MLAHEGPRVGRRNLLDLALFLQQDIKVQQASGNISYCSTCRVMYFNMVIDKITVWSRVAFLAAARRCILVPQKVIDGGILSKIALTSQVMKVKMQQSYRWA